jgi:hypothetical protein
VDSVRNSNSYKRVTTIKIIPQTLNFAVLLLVQHPELFHLLQSGEINASSLFLPWRVKPHASAAGAVPEGRTVHLHALGWPEVRVALDFWEPNETGNKELGGVARNTAR